MRKLDVSVGACASAAELIGALDDGPRLPQRIGVVTDQKASEHRWCVVGHVRRMDALAILERQVRWAWDRGSGVRGLSIQGYRPEVVLLDGRRSFGERQTVAKVGLPYLGAGGCIPAGSDWRLVARRTRSAAVGSGEPRQRSPTRNTEPRIAVVIFSTPIAGNHAVRKYSRRWPKQWRRAYLFLGAASSSRREATALNEAPGR